MIIDLTSEEFKKQAEPVACGFFSSGFSTIKNCQSFTTNDSGVYTIVVDGSSAWRWDSNDLMVWDSETVFPAT